MPEENKVDSAPETEQSDAAGKITRSIEKANPVVILLYIIPIMVVILVVINFRGNSRTQPGIGADDPVMAALKADLEARRAELNRQRMAMGLPPLESASEPVGEIAARLKKDSDTLVGLAGRFQQMLDEKDAEISRRNRELLTLEKQRQDISLENSRLQAEMNRAYLSASEADQLRKSAADMQAQRDALSRELADARAQLAEAAGSVNGEDFAILQRRYEEALRSTAFFENRVKELEAQLSRTALFAKSEDELLPTAVELFRRLRRLEGMDESDLNTEYAKIGEELGAGVVHTLDFATGSSELSAEDMAQLAGIAEDDAMEEGLTLIVGYASETGDAEANGQLSSQRAMAAAEFFDTRKRAGHKVQAVYLGQTDRFNSATPERNQICEVWTIRGK